MYQPFLLGLRIFLGNLALQLAVHSAMHFSNVPPRCFRRPMCFLRVVRLVCRFLWECRRLGLRLRLQDIGMASIFKGDYNVSI